MPSKILACIHNYPTAETLWNAATNQTGIRLNNGVHPASTGYHQIGDTVYAWLKSLESRL
jgi:hypothetical protein